MGFLSPFFFSPFNDCIIKHIKARIKILQGANIPAELITQNKPYCSQLKGCLLESLIIYSSFNPLNSYLLFTDGKSQEGEKNI